jgi:hypothetical protein
LSSSFDKDNGVCVYVIKGIFLPLNLSNDTGCTEMGHSRVEPVLMLTLMISRE